MATALNNVVIFITLLILSNKLLTLKWIKRDPFELKPLYLLSHLIIMRGL